MRDTREKSGMGYSWDESSSVFGTITKKLDTGDYSIEGLESILCIERKRSVNEIAQNIVQPRFWRELERMRTFEFAFLICEFSYDNVETYPHGSAIPKWQKDRIRVKPPYILSCLRRIQLEFDVPVLLCDNFPAAKGCVFNLMRSVWLRSS